MVQSFSTRYPLLDGHGNFGSVDNDPPAAMRYTETRLAPIANTAMLREIGEATVNFADNLTVLNKSLSSCQLSYQSYYLMVVRVLR